MTSHHQNVPPIPLDIAELQRLIDASCDGVLQPDERDRLESMLAGSSEARSIFRAYMQLDAGLAWRIRGRDSLSGLVELSNQEALEPAVASSRPPVDAPGWKGSRHRFFYPSIALVASLLVAVGAITWSWSQGGRNSIGTVAVDQTITRDDSTIRSPGTDGPVVANVVELSDDCRWFIENRQNRKGAAFAGDLIRITRGELRLDLTSGAAVTMKSPAALEVISPMRTRAVLGTFAAHVRKGAEGFTVETPRTSVVDLGTDFGIDVTAHGSTDVVVFSGAVDLRSEGVEGLNSRQRLTAGEGIRVSGEGTASRIVSIIHGQFSILGGTGRLRHRTPVISAVHDNIRRGESWHYYEIVHGGMSEDAKAFVDRKNHEWNGINTTGIPSYLLGGDYVKTFNDDKVNRQVKICVTLDCPSILYVLLDMRSPVPEWLREDFFNTGDVIGIDGGGYSRFDEVKTVAVGPGVSVDDRFGIWRRDVPIPGTVSLGAIQIGGGKHNMYGIVAVPMEIVKGHDDFPGSLELASSEATPLTADQGGKFSINGIIERLSDVDLFSFDWSGGAVEVDCQTSGLTSLDPVVKVLDANGALVGYGRTNRDRRDHAVATMNLPPGEYYIAVMGREEVGEVGAYQLGVALASSDVPPPPAPSPSLVLDAIPTAHGVALSWSSLALAEAYTIERSRDAVNFQPVRTTTTTYAVDDDLEPGEIYIYRLRADTLLGRPASAPVLVRAPAAAVEGLRAFGRSSESIILEWRDVVGEQGYRIERSVDGQQFESVATVPENACSYHDDDAEPGERYAYRVVTLNAGESDAISEPVWALSCVADLTADVVAADGVKLNWRIADSPMLLLVERAVGDGDEFVTIASLSGSAREFLDDNAVTDKDVRYRVVAVGYSDDLTEVRTGEIDRIRLPDGVDDVTFALCFRGKIRIDTPGSYYFELNSDDGSRLFVDEFLVVDNDWRHQAQAVSGAVELAAGEHDLEVQYFQSGGRSALDLYWAGPDFSKTELRSSTRSPLTYSYYQGHWTRLPFERSWVLAPPNSSYDTDLWSHIPFGKTCAVSEIVTVKTPSVSSGSNDLH